MTPRLDAVSRSFNFCSHQRILLLCLPCVSSSAGSSAFYIRCFCSAFSTDLSQQVVISIGYPEFLDTTDERHGFVESYGFVERRVFKLKWGPVTLVKSEPYSPRRAGIGVDVLRNGCSESRGHSAAAIFSLAVEEENRSVIAAIGGIPLLLELLGMGGGRDIAVAAEDAALALYYFSLHAANRIKMIHAGAVPILARRARRTVAVIGDGSASADDGVVRARCFMILYNLATLDEGRRALLGSDVHDSATEAIVEAKGTGPVVEQAVAIMLLMVGKGKALLVDTGPDGSLLCELRRLASQGRGRTKEKADALLQVLREAHAADFEDYGGGGGGREGTPPPAAGSSGWTSYHEANTARF
ncbi:U-box domain-containing protein 38 [Nymphaea thermarum]|nr:U-box domain-containing protein 38 [Nymphaea thermarum]